MIYDSYLTYNRATAADYLSYKLELDPRLSEVQRWWLDKTSPECEIIYTMDKAREVLDKFLVAEDIGEYMKTQSELNALIESYKKQGKEEEVYEALTTRLPGMAVDVDVSTEPPTTFA